MPDTTDAADLIDFTLTHALLRNELPRLASAFAGAPMTAAQEAVVEEHLRVVTDHLIRHHQEEDEFHWPLLASRAPGAVIHDRSDGLTRRLVPVFGPLALS